jgi:Concanavalin A-like lectin/glucanases superfamily
MRSDQPPGPRWPVISLTAVIATALLAIVLRPIGDPSAAFEGVEHAGLGAAPGGTTAEASIPDATSPSHGSDACTDEPPAVENEDQSDLLGEVPLPPVDPPVDADVVADYRFDGSLASSVSDAPDLLGISGNVRFGPGNGRPGLAFAEGAGLSLAPATGPIDPRVYSIEVLFRFRHVSGWRKIVDFKGAESDSGLYALNGCLNFFPVAVAGWPTIAQGAFAHVVITRDAMDQVVAYVDGAAAVSFHDEHGRGIIDAAAPLRFFVDDAVTNTEESSGMVSRIRLWERTLTGPEVARLACVELGGSACRPARSP